MDAQLRVQRAGEGRGEGVVTVGGLLAGSVVLREPPLLGRQTPPNRRSVLACGNPQCLAPLASPEAQLGLLAGQCSRASLATEPSGSAAAALASGGACWCGDGCGECYCCTDCRSTAAPAHR